MCWTYHVLIHMDIVWIPSNLVLLSFNFVEKQKKIPPPPPSIPTAHAVSKYSESFCVEHFGFNENTTNTNWYYNIPYNIPMIAKCDICFTCKVHYSFVVRIFERKLYAKWVANKCRFLVIFTHFMHVMRFKWPEKVQLIECKNTETETFTIYHLDM